MTTPSTIDVSAALILTLIISPLLTLTGAKGLDGLRALAKKFLDWTDPGTMN